MEKEVGNSSIRHPEADSAYGDDEPVLRPYKQRILPQIATVNRANVTMDEYSGLSLIQKRRTHFLSSNYVGEMAVMPGAWISFGSDEHLAGDELMFLADPKPVAEAPEAPSKIVEKGEESSSENKRGYNDKEWDDGGKTMHSSDDKK